MVPNERRLKEFQELSGTLSARLSDVTLRIGDLHGGSSSWFRYLESIEAVNQVIPIWAHVAPHEVEYARMFIAKLRARKLENKAGIPTQDLVLAVYKKLRTG